MTKEKQQKRHLNSLKDARLGHDKMGQNSRMEQVKFMKDIL